MTLTGNRCRCSGCGEYFNSTSMFDRHRAGDWKDRGSNRRCLSPAELSERGYLKNSAGFWIREGMPASLGRERARDEISVFECQSTAHQPQQALR